MVQRTCKISVVELRITEDLTTGRMIILEDQVMMVEEEQAGEEL